MRSDALLRAAPTVFVLLWSTGFVVAHYGTEDAGPLTFLGIRMCIVAAVLSVVAVISRAERLTRSQVGWMSLAAMGLHVTYLGGLFIAISLGMPSGITALISGLHPVLTSVVSGPLLGERLSGRQWLGVGLGFSGVVVVVIDRVRDGATSIPGLALFATLVSVVGMSAGTLLQRRKGAGVPLLWGTAVQYTAAAPVFVLVAVLNEHWRVHVTGRLVLSLAWAVGVLSIGAVMLMLLLLRRQAAATVGSLFFLTPALSTIEGAILFGERLGAFTVVGFVVALSGVALTLRRT